MYHLVAASEPTGRKFTTTSVPVSRRIPATSSVCARRLLDDLAEVFADPVVRHPPCDPDPGLGHVRELDRVVGVGPDRVGEILADLVLGDVEGGGELDVADVVAAEVDVHQPGDEVVARGVLVVLDALHERARAVADADDRDADLAVVTPGLAVQCWHLFLSAP